MADPSAVYHEDAELFRDALRFTATETQFSERLIEKDYYCSVALADLAAAQLGLAFKGGTCLSKVHGGFYRLSEDLDFGLSTPVSASRSERRRQIAPVTAHLNGIERRGGEGVFRVAEPLRGFNNSTQYTARLAYRSSVTGQDDVIKIEVSAREPLVDPTSQLPARTLLTDPFRRMAVVPPFPVAALSRCEAYAEKLRAALTRHDPAVRDFFDLDHAFRAGSIQVGQPDLLAMLRRKLLIPGNGPVDVSPAKLNQLRGQLLTELRPVLRSSDYDRFDLEQVFRRVAEVAAFL
jgi:predicted nucleotidyltransferase component of viral defense system